MLENPIIAPSIRSLTGAQFIQGLIAGLINLAFIVGLVAFMLMLLTGAIQWITSGGDKGSVETAKGRITNAVIGLVILLAVYAIFNLIEQFFDMDILYFDLDFINLYG